MLSALSGSLQHSSGRGLDTRCALGSGDRPLPFCPWAADKGEDGRPVGTDRDRGAHAMCDGQDELSMVSGQRWGPAGQRDSTAKGLDVRMAGPSGSGISVVWSKAGRDPGGGATWGGETREVRGRDLE